MRRLASAISFAFWFVVLLGVFHVTNWAVWWMTTPAG